MPKLIVDFSPLVVASYTALAYQSQDKTVDIDLVRHVALDGIRFVNSNFKRTYGNPIIAVDCKKSWRKETFPYYKANRAKMRKESDINWAELLQCVNTVKDELIEAFPYKVLEVDRAEADDIIGVLARKAVAEGEEVMIVSGDKDFVQLQADTNLVRQWDKRTDTFIGVENPKRFLFEHVLKGDSGDGIPNVISPSDSYVTKTRQKPMTQKRLDHFWENKHELKEMDRFKLNLQLIDLRFTPKDIQENIIKADAEYKCNDRNGLQNYFIAKRMKKLYEKLNEF